MQSRRVFDVLCFPLRLWWLCVRIFRFSLAGALCDYYYDLAVLPLSVGRYLMENKILGTMERYFINN